LKASLDKFHQGAGVQFVQPLLVNLLLGGGSGCKNRTKTTFRIVVICSIKKTNGIFEVFLVFFAYVRKEPEVIGSEPDLESFL
jgi:hypothetical protein